jgi:hypothetical protein
MKAVLQWVLRTMMKDQTGVMRTLPRKDLVDFNVAMTAERLMRNGIDPNALKNANQVENAIKMIDDRPAVQEGITSTPEAKVFDMEGKEIPKGAKIMGGKEVKETDTQIKARLEKGNKEGIARIRARQKMLDDAIDNQSPSLSGDTRTDAVLVAEDLAERMGLVYDDLPIREQTKLYDQAYQGLSKMRFEARQTPKGAPPKITSKKDADSQESSYDDGPADFDPDADNETFAQGGRAGFANGTGAPSIKLFPRARGREIEQEVGPGFKISERDIDYGITGLLQGDKFFGGAEIDKGKVKVDVVSPEGDTVFKDTISKDDAVNFILGMGDPRGDKFQVKTDKDFKNMQITFRKQFADGGRTGYFLGSKYPKGLGLLREILKYSSKKGKELDKFKGVDLSALDMLRLSNPKRFNKFLEDVQGKVNLKEGIMSTDMVRAQQEALRKQRKGLTAGALQVAKDMKARDDAIAKRIAEEAEKTIIPQTKKMMMEGMGMSEEAAERAARDLAKAGQNMRLIDDSPRITEEGLLQLENVLKNLETAGKKKRDLNAYGGRIGFKDGMTRRTFLKIFGGLVSLPIIGKIVKPLKLTTGVKKVPIIKTDNVPGKPEWFDQLVNKVIVEGDDVTKKFATGERQSIHQKTLDDGSVVRVTEDVDDGAVRVEYESEQNVFGDPVQLEYKKPLPDEGAPDPKAEFTTAESGPVGKRYGPDNYEIEVDEVGGSSIVDLDSDVSKLKEYATGKGPTMKEFIQNKKRREKAAAITDDPAAQSDAVVRRQGEMDSSDYETLGTGDDFASGGIARLLGE